MTEIVSRNEAKAKGLKVFFTGEPCMYGHIAERYVSSSGCVVCTKNRADKRYEEHREERLAYFAEKYKENPRKYLERTKRYVQNNRLKRNAYIRNRRARNIELARKYEKEWRERRGDLYRQVKKRYRAKNHLRLKAYFKAHYQLNRDKILQQSADHYAANSSRYKARNLRHYRENKTVYLVKWAKRRAIKMGHWNELSDDEMRRVHEIYAECRRLSQETGIIHHVDHKKPLSKGGKHHPPNLQILTGSANLRKHAKWEEEDEAALMSDLDVSGSEERDDGKGLGSRPSRSDQPQQAAFDFGFEDVPPTR